MLLVFVVDVPPDGLWPEKEDGTHVANCPPSEKQKKFDIKDLQSILPELTKFMPSLTKMPERVMWENDWGTNFSH